MGITKGKIRELSLRIVDELKKLPPVDVSLTAAEAAELAQLMIVMNKDGAVADESSNRAAKIFFDAGLQVANEAGLVGAKPVNMSEMDEIILKRGLPDRSVSVNAVDLSSLAAELIQSVHVGPGSSDHIASAVRKVIEIGDGMTKSVTRRVIMSLPEFSQLLN